MINFADDLEVAAVAHVASPTDGTRHNMRRAALAYAAEQLEATGEAGTLSAIVLLGQLADDEWPSESRRPARFSGVITRTTRPELVLADDATGGDGCPCSGGPGDEDFTPARGCPIHDALTYVADRVARITRVSLVRVPPDPRRVLGPLIAIDLGRPIDETIPVPAHVGACAHCEGSRQMYHHGLERDVMCTRCPIPCDACRDGTRAFCVAHPCECACHRGVAIDPAT